jgi:hypothetical protein
VRKKLAYENFNGLYDLDRGAAGDNGMAAYAPGDRCKAEWQGTPEPALTPRNDDLPRERP